MKWKLPAGSMFLLARGAMAMSLIFCVAVVVGTPRYGVAWWVNLAGTALDALFLTFLSGPPIMIAPSDADIRRIISQMVSERHKEWIKQWRQNNPPH